MRFVIGWTIVALTLATGCTETAAGPVFPSAPEGVKVSITADRQVEISWEERPERENVVAYGVYRDGLLIGETATLTMIDSLAPQSRNHEYSVASRSSDGIVSERSAGVPVFAPDAIPPRTVSVSPSDGSANVSPLSTVQVRFNEAMDSASFTPVSFTVRDAMSNAGIAGSIKYDNTTRTATWSPSQPLPSERRVSVTLSGVKDASGLVLAQPVAFSFTVRETSPPFVVSFSPSNGSTVAVGTMPSVKFSERMGNLSGIRWLDPSGSLIAVGGTQDTLTNTVTLLPSKRVRSFVLYRIQIDERTTDVAGNALLDTLSFAFQYSEWSLPAVASVFPAEGATGVPVTAVLSVDLATPTQYYNDYEVRFNLRETGSSTTLPAFWIWPNSGTRITLTPPTLKPATSYTAVFYHFFTDSGGVRRELEKVWTFTTAGSTM